MKPTYYTTVNHDGTEDEITICTPEGRPIAALQFWDCDIEGSFRADADAKLIVAALNAYRRRKPRKKRNDSERIAAQTKSRLMISLSKPMPAATMYRA